MRDKFFFASYIIIIFLVCLSFGFLYAQEDGGLSELQKLKAQNHQLKLQLTQCQVTTAQNTLSDEQNSLLSDFRKTLNPKEGQVFNWQTLKFEDEKK